MKIKNILVKVPRLKFYKKEAIYIIRGILLFGTFFMFLATYLRPFDELFKFALNISLIYLMLTFTYFAFLATSEDRKILVNMWKVYFPSVFILFAIVYTTDTYVTKTKIDHEKVKLNYYLKSKDFDKAKEVFEKYNLMVESHIKTYDKEKVEESVKKSFSQEKNTTEKDKYVLWYVNIPINLINILTMLFFVWGFTELSIFSIKRKY